MNKNIRVLDCTLRDGGRLIDCAFDNEEIVEMTRRLTNAKIDIIEVGFLRDWRDVKYKGNSTFFTDVDQIKAFLPKNRNAIYVAFVDYGMFDFDSLKTFDGESIDGIRFGFTKKNYLENKDDIIRDAKTIIKKGYKLFVQGVNTLNYSDRELLELVELVNDIHPYSFGIVDTYGAMYIEDVDRIFGLIDNNMLSDICIDFHSHNNYQLSFAFAQEIIKLSDGKREIIIDSTLEGMGKVAGNLNTELIVNYLARKLNYNYEMDDILDIIDDYIFKYAEEFSWGYSIPGMMAGIYKAHPNNIIYLTDKYRMDTKDVGNILSMISSEKRQVYDYDNIEKKYIEYSSNKMDDSDSLDYLRDYIGNKEVLLIAPGKSVSEYKNDISIFLELNNPVVISVNHVPDFKIDFAFYGNAKRYSNATNNNKYIRKIVTSNVKELLGDEIVVNYQALICRGYKYFDNSSIMLLNLLKRLNVSGIAIAGLDGFDKNTNQNYIDRSFQNSRYKGQFDLLNRELKDMLDDYKGNIVDSCNLRFITPSLFE